MFKTQKKNRRIIIKSLSFLLSVSVFLSYPGRGVALTSNEIPSFKNAVNPRVDENKNNLLNKLDEEKLKTQISKKFADIQFPFIDGYYQAGNNKAVEFSAKIFSGDFFVTKNSLNYSFFIKNKANLVKSSLDNKRTKEDNLTYLISEQFIDTDNAVVNFNPIGFDKSKTKISIFKGNNKSEWRTNISSYDSLYLGKIWSDIDVILRAHSNNVEKIFIVNPSADPDEIKVKVNSANKIEINQSGELVIETSNNKINMSKPTAYQYDDSGKKINVDLSYKILKDNSYGFSVDKYDPSRPLIIDPLLASTFFEINSSNDTSYLRDIATNSNDDVIVTGSVDDDAFVAILNNNLTELNSYALISGSDGEISNAVNIDSSNYVYISGWTDSNDFPGMSGQYYDQTNAFAIKLNPSLSSLEQSTIINGTDGQYSEARDIKVTPSSVYVVGQTMSENFPVNNCFQCSIGGNSEGFIIRLNTSLTSILSATYFGGTNDEEINKVAYDNNGNIIVAGRTDTDDNSFPISPDAYDDQFLGMMFPGYVGTDTFAANLSSDLSYLNHSSFLGAQIDNGLISMTIDNSGKIYVFGHIHPYQCDGQFCYLAVDPKAIYEVPENAFDTTTDVLNGSSFIGIYKNDLTDIIYGTLIDHTSGLVNGDIAVDSNYNVLVTSSTNNSSFVTTKHAYDREYNGGSDDAYLIKFNNQLTQLKYSTFLGGSENYDSSYSLILDSNENIFLGGETSDDSFPTTMGVYQRVFDGSSNGFVTKFSISSVEERQGEPDYPALPSLTAVSDFMNTNKANVNSAVTHELYITPAINFSGSANKITITFPAADSAKWCRNAGSDIEFTASGLKESGATPLPGSLTGYCQPGESNESDILIIRDVGSLNSGTLYGVKIAGGSNAILGTGDKGKKEIDVKLGDDSQDIEEARFQVEILIDPEVNISGFIPPTLTFSITDNSIGFGNLIPTVVRFATSDGLGSDSEPINNEPVSISTSTNADDGVSIYIRSMYAGLFSAGTIHTISSIASSSVTAGSEGYGIYGKNTNNITVDTAYDNNGISDEPVSATGTIFAYTENPVANASVDIASKCAISESTPAGLYSDTLTITATGKF